MLAINPPAPATAPTRTIVEVVRANAQTHPDKLALVCENTSISWREFDRRINKIANLLLSMGVAKGDNIAIISPNSIGGLRNATVDDGISGCVTENVNRLWCKGDLCRGAIS